LASAFQTWTVPARPVAIEYTPAVLEEIRVAAVDAFFKIPHGGLEIGGVLFGQRKDGLVRIESCRMLSCDYASGPSFVLSLADQDRRRDLLTTAAAEGLAPVGWFRSRTRSGIALTEADAYFGEAWQVALVLRPEATRPTRAAFFAHGASLGEFVLEPWAPVAEPLVLAGPVLSPPQESHSRAPWIAALCLGLAGAGLGGHEYLGVRRQPQEPLLLESFDRAGQLQLSWDRAARTIRDARGAKLEITDGENRMSTHLAASQLQQGSFYYVRRTERVDVHLTVFDARGRSTEEYASFFGAMPAP
jgi:hypothetical protein